MPRITRQTLVGEALRLNPAAEKIFTRHGMACSQCMEAADETIEDAARMHESEDDILASVGLGPVYERPPR